MKDTLTISKRSWSIHEDNKLRAFYEQFGPDWKNMDIQDRTIKQCRERWNNVLDPNLKKTNWSAEEDQIILIMQKQVGNKWSEIAQKLVGRADVAVKNRYAKLITNFNQKVEKQGESFVDSTLTAEEECALALTEFKRNVSSQSVNTTFTNDCHNEDSTADVNPLKAGKHFVKRSWSVQEDNSLRELVKKYGITCWKVISEFMPNRSLKQCRERWNLTLDPTINRDAWTAEDDNIILKMQQRIGNKWVEIAKFLPGRVDIAVKNRFARLKHIEKQRRLRSIMLKNNPEIEMDNVSFEDKGEYESSESSSVKSDSLLKKRSLMDFSTFEAPLQKQKQKHQRLHNSSLIDENVTDQEGSPSRSSSDLEDLDSHNNRVNALPLFNFMKALMPMQLQLANNAMQFTNNMPMDQATLNMYQQAFLAQSIMQTQSALNDMSFPYLSTPQTAMNLEQQLISLHPDQNGFNYPYLSLANLVAAGLQIPEQN